MAKPAVRNRLRDDRDEERAGSPAAHHHDLVPDPVSRAIVREAASPEAMTSSLAAVDDATKARALEELQRTYGNRYVQQIVAGLAARSAGGAAAGITTDLARPAIHTEVSASGTGFALAGIQREGEEPSDEDPGVEPLDTPVAAAAGATEQIGPETSSTYDVAGTTLADVAAALEARPEAGHVEWAPKLDFTTADGVIDSVRITADITLEMPAWTPPTTMLPKARAEWTRWYGALLAHESGHIKLVHDLFDGLAAKLIGKTKKKGQSLFDAARATLASDSATYDKTTDHGRKAGTIMDIGIEQKEIEDKDKKEREKEKAGEKKPASEVVPGA